MFVFLSGLSVELAAGNGHAEQALALLVARPAPQSRGNVS